MAQTSAVSDLLNMLAEDRGLHEIVDCCASYLGNPLLLMDSTMNLLAVCGSPDIKDEIWEDFLAGKSRTKEYADEEYTIELMRRVMSASQPVLSDYNQTRKRRVVGKVASGNSILGYIVCLEYYHEFPGDIVTLSKTVCSILAIALQRLNTLALPESGSHERILQEILRGKKEPGYYSEKFLNTIYGSADGSFYIISIPIADEELSPSQVSYLQQHLNEMAAYSCTVNIGTELVILLSASQSALPAVLRRYSTILDLYKLKAGISEAFVDVAQICERHRQASNAAATGAVLDRHPISSYETIMLYDMLRTLSMYADIRQYCPPAIGQLKRYDMKYGTDYLKTLRVYLKQSGNIRQTAEKLFAHRNTIVHRVERIQEVCGCDLSDGDMRAKLAVGLMICELLDAER